MEHSTPKKKLPAPALAAIIVAALLVVLAAAYCGLCAWARGNGRLPPNTAAYGGTEQAPIQLDLGGLTRDEAIAEMDRSMDKHLQERVLDIHFGNGKSARLTGELLASDPAAAVDYGLAFKTAQPFLKQGLLWLGLGDEVRLSLSASTFTQEGERAAKRLIQTISDQLYVAPVDFTWELGDETVDVTPGSDGQQVDAEGLLSSILDALATGQSQLTVTPEPLPSAELSGQSLSQLLYVAPQAPTMGEDGKLTPTVVGRSVDPDEAQAILDAAEPGQTCTIPLIFIPPDLTEAEQYLYRDLLASCSSYLDGNANRSYNVGLAASSCNGTVIMPGQVFSYLNTIGSPSEENGYKMSTGYAKGETVDMVGGGICQVSSSLYYCAVYSNLEIVQRACHAFIVGYLPNGLDATVYYPTLDFLFRNNTEHPIKVVTYVEGNKLYMQFYGTNTTGNYVKTERYTLSSTPYETVYEPDETIPQGTTKVKTTPYTGYEVDVYRCVYSADGVLISRTYENHSKYAKRDKVILYNPADAEAMGLVDPTVSPSPDPEPGSSASPEPSPEPSPDVSPEPGVSPEPSPSPPADPAPSDPGDPQPTPSTGDEGM